MSCRGFEPVCTNNELREYFSAKGLTYDSIDEGDILILCMMLQKELKKSNKAGETSVTMTLSKRVDMKKATNGHIKPLENAEGYHDPTAYHGTKNIIRDEDEQQKRVNTLIFVLKYITRLAGFELLNRIEIKDRKTGREYK